MSDIKTPSPLRERNGARTKRLTAVVSLAGGSLLVATAQDYLAAPPATAELTASSNPATTATTAPNSAVARLIPWLLDEATELRGVPFSEVIFDATGKRVLSIDRDH